MMKKTEIKALEAKLSKLYGHKVEVVLPNVIEMNKGKKSVDQLLLESENKQRLAFAESEKRRAVREQARKAKSLTAGLSKCVDWAYGALEELADDMSNGKDPFDNIKAVRAVKEYFFGTEYEITGHYDHSKDDTLEEGNVTYLSRDFKNLK